MIAIPFVGSYCVLAFNARDIALRVTRTACDAARTSPSVAPATVESGRWFLGPTTYGVADGHKVFATRLLGVGEARCVLAAEGEPACACAFFNDEPFVAPSVVPRH